MRYDEYGETDLGGEDALRSLIRKGRRIMAPN